MRRSKGIIRAVIGSMLCLLLTAADSKRESARVVRVISGDTLTIQYNLKWEEIKMIGIIAPDINLNNMVYEGALREALTPEQIIRRGKQSQTFLKGILRYGSQVWIEFDVQKRDRFGRMLGYIYLPNGKMLNEVILEEGYAYLDVIPPNLLFQDKLALAFMRGKEGKKGFWKPVHSIPQAAASRKK